MASYADLIGTAGDAASVRTPAQKIAKNPPSTSKPDKISSKASKQGGKTHKQSAKTGSKSSNQGRKQSASNTPVEMVAGDVVQTSGGVASSLMPASVDDVARMAPAWIGEWCELHAVQDMRKASPLVFRACCQDIGARYVKPSGILKDTRPHGLTPTGGASTCGAYDVQAVAALYNIFCRVCGEWDKVPFASTFAGFSGVSLSYVREYADGLTSSGLDFRQKTHAAEMDAIRQSASRDPVGRIAILNNEHWASATRDDQPAAVAVKALPRFDVSGGVVD